ncbi:MAG: DHH family phosphoesterase [Clostridiales bacterium]|nr:DHH family phosphoesterase [Clostridiales bacterium]
MTKLDELVSVINVEHIYIQTHNFPDPDAISSAFGLQNLLFFKGIKSTICYKGKIDRYNTRKMVELFNIEVVDVDTVNDLTEDDLIVLIDAQKGSGNTFDIVGREIACIDHHPTFENVDYIWSDIRPEVGACASIIASYFFENNIPMDNDVAESLLFGIKIDTADLGRGVSSLDLDMFYKIFKRTDRKKIGQLEKEVLQLEDLKAFANAIDTIKINDNIGFANTGDNCPEALIATIADFMLEIVDVNVAVVYSIKGEGIKISVRCIRSSEYNAGQAILDALKGIGTGGGHSTMAGGYVPLKKEMIPEDVVFEIQERFTKTIKK